MRITKTTLLLIGAGLATIVAATPIGAQSIRSYGKGTPGTGAKVPLLWVTSMARPAATRFGLTFERGLSKGVAIPFLSLRRGQINFAGVNILIDLGVLKAWSEFSGLKLVNIHNQMDTLIGIQRDRIAPAVESINSKTPVEINFTPTINVTVQGGASQRSSPRQPSGDVGGPVGDEIIKTIKEGITLNRGGLRTALQNI